MIIKKSVQLTTEPFEALIKNGEAIDFRLDEPAWENLFAGDFIEFWEDFSGWDKKPSAKSRQVTAKITEIFRAATFEELIDNFPASFLIGEKKEDIIADLRQWWTPERERENGVLGWKVQLI